MPRSSTSTRVARGVAQLDSFRPAGRFKSSEFSVITLISDPLTRSILQNVNSAPLRNAETSRAAAEINLPQTSHHTSSSEKLFISLRVRTSHKHSDCNFRLHSNSNQLTYRRAKWQDRHWSAGVVEERIVGVDAEMTIDCGPEIVGCERPFFRMFAF